MTDLPTPLTDAFCAKLSHSDKAAWERWQLTASFAGDLERRMAAARKLLAEAREILPMDMRVYERIQEGINHLTP